jgi:ABC-2 type transport system permease protein
MELLITAEYRKILTTKLWWALLIPAAVLSLGFTWGGAVIGAVADVSRSLRGTLPLALPGFAQGINYATVFALILGGTAVTGEMRHKTITTSYLTGPTRGAVLTAKMLVYSTFGALYGVVCMLAATIGALLGNNFPDGGDWFALAGVGVLAMIMWTLVGVGIGALMGNQVGTIVGTVVYVLVIEPILSIVLRTNDLGQIPPFLPNSAGSSMVTSLSFDLFFSGLSGTVRQSQRLNEEFRSVFGLTYSPDWWSSGLIFAGYAVLIGMIGWIVARNRDIT